jgi:hypothetical protein
LFSQARQAASATSRSKFGVAAMPLRWSHGSLKSSYWKASEKPIWFVSSRLAPK